MSVEKFYHRLLLAYPKPYRQEHGDELVGTLLEASSRDTPSPRESFALVRAGIAQRIRGNLTGPDSWAECLHLAITFMVLNELAFWINPQLPEVTLLSVGPVLVALAILRGWFLLALPLSLLLTANVTFETLTGTHEGPDSALTLWANELLWPWATTLSLVALAVNRLQKGRSAVRSRSWLWLMTALPGMAILVVVTRDAGSASAYALADLRFALEVVLVLLALCATWATRDLRWGAAAGLVMIGQSFQTMPMMSGDLTDAPFLGLIQGMTPMLLVGAAAMVVGRTWRRSRV